MDMQKEYFECACHSDEHTLKFVYDPDENELYTSVFLNEDRFFHRVWNGLKYIFGYKCKYGHWNCWLLRPEDVDRLLKLINKVKDGEQKQKK